MTQAHALTKNLISYMSREMLFDLMDSCHILCYVALTEGGQFYMKPFSKSLIAELSTISIRHEMP